MPPAELLDAALLAAAGVAAVAGLMRGFAGFGSAMFMAPPFAILFGPRDMVAMVTLLEVAVSMQLVPPTFRAAEWRFVGPLTLASVAAMPIGLWALVALEPRTVVQTVSVIIVLFVGILAFGWRYRGPKRLSITLGVGFFSGAMMGTTSVGGPPVLLYMLSGPDSAAQNRSNIIQYFASTGVLLLALLFGGGVVGQDALWRTLLLLVPFLACAYLGARLFRASSERLYRRVALAFLLAAGLFGLLR